MLGNFATLQLAGTSFGLFLHELVLEQLVAVALELT